MPFGLIDPDAPRDRPADADAAGQLIRKWSNRASSRDLQRTADRYHPTPELVDAINVALTVGAPLLLTGKPGTGKTQVAYYLQWYLHVPDEHFHVHAIRSGSTADELTYTLDEVRYFHAAQGGGAAPKIADHINKGPLWKAYRAGRQSIVLIDEIDKASRDFPNDLLFVLDQHKFRVPELDVRDAAGNVIKPEWIALEDGTPAPLIVITSNSERRLPEPFLRRCIFHHIEASAEQVKAAVRAHRERWKHLDDALVEVATERGLSLEQRRVRAPTLGELLVWISILDAMAGAGHPIVAAELRDAELRDLPAISALIKDGDDLGRL